MASRAPASRCRASRSACGTDRQRDEQQSAQQSAHRPKRLRRVAAAIAMRESCLAECHTSCAMSGGARRLPLDLRSGASRMVPPGMPTTPTSHPTQACGGKPLGCDDMHQCSLMGVERWWCEGRRLVPAAGLIGHRSGAMHSWIAWWEERVCFCFGPKLVFGSVLMMPLPGRNAIWRERMLGGKHQRNNS